MKYWLAGFADASNGHKLLAGQTSLIVSILSAGTFIGALSAVGHDPEYATNHLALLLSHNSLRSVNVLNSSSRYCRADLGLLSLQIFFGTLTDQQFRLQWQI
jgi:hypothetical protein